MRRILHIDMDAFFAAIELQRRPELEGRPVIVGGHGDPGERGVVSAASYEARAFGIHSAMPLRTARHLCPQAAFLPVDYPHYQRISRRIKGLLQTISPVMEDAGIDEAYLDISRIAGNTRAIGTRVKELILKETEMTCSVGIGPNRLLAKMAAGLEKPDGLTVLAASEVEKRLWPLSARKIPGVGPKTEQRLAGRGVRTIGELAAHPLADLVALFGPSQGHWMHQAARGMDNSPLVTARDPRSFSRETTFQRDVRDGEILATVLAWLAEEVTKRLRREGRQARTVTVKLRYADFETHTRALTLGRATDRLDAIRKAATQCLRRFPLTRKVRLLGVRVSGLEKT